MSNGIKIPRCTKFSPLRRRLKRFQIHWDESKGKGGHGSFVGPHKITRQIQAYTLPSSQTREVHIVYIKGLMERFGLTPEDLFQ